MASDGRGYYKMILLLLFSISSTIRASVAQKPKPIFFSMERSQQGMPLKIIQYSVKQSDGNSWKIDTFREAITYELMISYQL